MDATVIFKDDYYHIQHVKNGNDKLVVYIKNGPGDAPDKHQYQDDHIDLYVKTILNLGFDVIYVRATRLFDMYDIPCIEGMNKIKQLCSNYTDVRGFFVCGGNVLGLYYSKLIPYNKIYCVSPRFLDGMTMSDDRVKHFKYQNNKVSKQILNTEAEYVVVYNIVENEGFDKVAAEWLRYNVIKYKQYVLNEDTNTIHLIEEAIGLKNYFKYFIGNLLNASNLSGVPHFS